MELKDWYTLLNAQLVNTSIIEWMALGFGIAEVLLAKRNHIWLYPTGIISILLSMFMLINVRLYAETLLNMYYLVMSIYGWIAWRKKSTLPALDISWCSNTELRTAVIISGGGFVILYLVLRHFTNSDVPLWDAFVSSTAWAGMWLLARRKIENWIFLNLSNLFAIPLLVHKKLPMLALLTAILFIVAIFGYLDWKKKLTKKLTAVTV
jgi:nicotinamide mononucleotide transporter